MKDAITPAQDRFIHLKSHGANTAEAERGAGLSQGYGYDLLRKDHVRTELAKRMENAGVTREKIANKIAEGFDSMAPPRKDGGIQYPDMFTRRQYVDMALRVLGEYAPDELNINQRVINITITPEVTKGLIDAQVIEADLLEELEYVSIENTGEKEAGSIKDSQEAGAGKPEACEGKSEGIASE